MVMDEGLTIAEVAARTGLTAYTLRYYERAGLLEPPVRGGNGHRRYGSRDLDRIALMTRLRATGMSISDMRRYADLIGMGDTSASARRALLVAHRERVAARIAQLGEDLALINYKIAVYEKIEEGLS